MVNTPASAASQPVPAPAHAAATGAALVDPQQTVASAWADQALWSQVANQLGDSIRRWRARAAVAGVAGLFLSLLAGNMASGSVGQKVVASLGVLLLALVPFLQQRLLSADRTLAWTRARHVAELLKEAIYRHLMGALAPVPLDDGSDAPDPSGPGNLVRRCRAIKRSTADLALLAATAQPEPRQRKTVMGLSDYLADRLEGQISYYRKSSLAAGTQAQRLQQLEFALGLLTVLLGALAGNLLPAAATPDLAQSAPLAPWLALIATTAAAVSSHIAGTRNLELAATYFATHDLLKTLRDEWAVAPDRDTPARVRRLVDAVERAIAAEHGGWVSDWQQSARQAATAAATTAQPQPRHRQRPQPSRMAHLRPNPPTLPRPMLPSTLRPTPGAPAPDQAIPMGYLPQFKNDLFISYRRTSNEGQDPWVDNFCASVRAQLRDLVGDVQMWRDTAELRAGDAWRPEIADAVDSTGIFLAVISRTYFDSDECRKELDRFLGRLKSGDGAGVPGGGRKLVPIYKHPPKPDQQLPRELAEIGHHEFFNLNPKPWRELDPKRDYDDYHERLGRVVFDLMAALEELQGLQKKQALGKVFIANVGPELLQERERLRTDLRQRGFLVVPEHEYLWNADDHRERIARDLGEALLCIHLVQRQASIEPLAPARARLQLELAHAEMQAPRPACAAGVDPARCRHRPQRPQPGRLHRERAGQ